MWHKRASELSTRKTEVEKDAEEKVGRGGDSRGEVAEMTGKCVCITT